MPGIVGILGAGQKLEMTALLQRMTKTIIHETFYVSGTYSDDDIGLWVGWANIKGSFSDCMPLWNEKRDICLVFMGEEFTDLEEINRLKQKGHEFVAGNADYLIHLYEELGDEFFGKLNGRFSGVIVDLRKKKAILFNDRYGLGRIYYHETRGMLFFSSEAKSLLAVLPELRQIDSRSLAETFSLGCVIQDRSLFKGVSLVPGGSAWIFLRGRKPVKSRYFDQRKLERLAPLDRAEYYKKLKETWNRVLPRYLRATQSIALSLTGGKDCRMILAWSKSPPGSLPCYTFGGPYRDCYDVTIARKVARISKQPWQVIRVGDRFLEEFPMYAEKTVYVTDGTMDVSGSPGMYVNRLAREIAPVRLTGNYGQEILRTSVAFKPTSFFLDVLETEFAGLVKSASQRYRYEREGNELSFIAFKQLPWHHYPRLASELSQLTLRSPYLDNEIVQLAFRAPRTSGGRDELQLSLTAEGNPELACVETDRGLLYKPIPLYTRLKHELLMLTVKAEYAYDYGMTRSIAKIDNYLEWMHLERIFLGRNKYYHFRIWYRDVLSGYIKEMLLDPVTKRRGFLKGKVLDELVRAHINGTANHTIEIHRLLTVELIHRQFIEMKG